MIECEACLSQLASRDGLCERCHAWSAYWHSLSAEEQEEELCSMDRHVTGVEE